MTFHLVSPAGQIVHLSVNYLNIKEIHGSQRIDLSDFCYMRLFLYHHHEVDICPLESNV